MAYFVKIGANKENKSGVESRGYHLFRRGKCIVARWGAIIVTRNRKFYWCYAPQEELYKYRSEQAARDAIQQFIQQRVQQHGYSRLPAGVGIKQTRHALLN
jgi:hypothetical protein